MEKQQITIQVSKELLKEYDKYYSDVYKGLELGINAWISIRRDTINEMNGFFTKDEVKFLIEFVKDIDHIECYYDLPINLIITEEELSCRDIESIAKRHNINYHDFCDKVRNIGMGKSTAILDWANAYWSNGIFREITMDDYIKILTEKSKGSKVLDKIDKVYFDNKNLEESETNKRLKEAVSESDINTLLDELHMND
ncbi:hypothetical protein AN1V17_14130 [Vallitalea sediminicola]